MVILLSSHVTGVHSPGRALLLWCLGSCHHVGISVGWDGRWVVISINLHLIDLITAPTGTSCWSRVPLLRNVLILIDRLLLCWGKPTLLDPTFALPVVIKDIRDFNVWDS